LEPSSNPNPNHDQVWARVVIVAYLSGSHLQKCIDALASQTFTDFEVVIVNNQSPDRCVDSLVLPDARFATVDATSNLGFSGGSNLGAKNAISDWIITLNPDTIPNADWLFELKKATEQNCEFASLSSTLLNAKDPSIVDGFGDVISIYGIFWRGGLGAKVDTLPNCNVEVFGPCAAAAGYRRDVFEAMGGFDPDFFCYLEDVDLSFRLLLAGHRCIQVRSALVKHVGSASSENDLSFPVYHTYKNNLRLIIRNAPFSILGLMLCAYCISQTYIIFKNRRDTFTSARLRGVMHAVKTIPMAWQSRRSMSRISKTGRTALKVHMVWAPRSVSKLVPKYIPIKCSHFD